MNNVAQTWDAAAGAPVTPMYAAGTPTQIPLLTHMLFQGMFFIITPALICGAFAERMKFSTMVVFMILVGHVRLLPAVPLGVGRRIAGLRAHADLRTGNGMRGGALDFAGGTVVHISSGVSALICALVIGQRLGYRQRADAAAQPDLHGAGRRDAVGGLVRFQRRQ